MNSPLTNLVRSVRKTVRRFWPGLQGPPDYSRIRSLAELGRLQPRVQFDFTRAPVPGWLTPAEQRALYSLARWAPGPFLEIGPWLGLSTVTLALGIADSGEKKDFVTREINPTSANFRPIDAEHIGLYIPPESTESMGVCSRESFERDIEPVVSDPGGVAGHLKENLARCGVAERVRVSLGDFRELEAQPYRFVFSDALHDELEIRRNSPHLRRFLSVGSILACHDTTDANVKLLNEYFRFGEYFRADSLFVAEIVKI